MDDLFVVVEVGHIQKVCDMIALFFNTYDMEINVKKINAMYFGHNTHRKS